MSRVQHLYELTRKTFSPGVGGIPPSPTASQRLLETLDTITCDDVGLRDAAEQSEMSRVSPKPYQSPAPYKSPNARPGAATQPRWHPPITYLHIAETEHYSIGIFCIPARATIPMHNHPGMSVFSRLLYGRLHLRSYDWAEPGASPPGDPKATPRMARLVRDAVLEATIDAPCPSVALFPEEGGNLHSFTALTPTAVLDVMGPPYAPGNGRGCTYYREELGTLRLPEGGEQVGEQVLKELVRMQAGGIPEGQQLGLPAGSVVGLVEMEPAGDFVVRRGTYTGSIPEVN